RTARRLVAHGQVQQRTIMAVELSAAEPLFTWQPGNRDAPEFNRLAWRNRKRWLQRLLRTECLIATPAAQELYGGHTRPPRDRELNHDLHVAEVYLQLRKRAPERAKAWRLEDELEQITQKQERP